MRKRSSFLQLAIAEPFRAFFPLGMAWGIVGVSLWPLHFIGWVTIYPMMSHMRLMTQGFLGSFIFGFLLTAGPRLLSAPRPATTAVTLFFICCLVNGLFTLVGLHNWADFLFLFQLLFLVAIFASFFANRGDLPPPGFVLALAGLLSGMVGAALMWHNAAGNTHPATYFVAKTLLFQAFPIFPVVGIGAYFFPKLTGGDNPHDFPVNPKPSGRWTRSAIIAATTAAVFWISIFFEAKGFISVAYATRAGVIALYLVLETPVFKTIKRAGKQQVHLRLICLAILLGLIGTAAMPVLHIAWLHLLFIGALTSVILVVSSRVVFGHSGSAALAHISSRPLLICLSTLLLAAAFRILADYIPADRRYFMVTAAILWIIVAATWFVFVGIKARVPDPEDG